MAQIYRTAKDPIGMPVDSAIYYEGELLKKSSTAGRLCKSAAKGDEIVAVVDKDTLTAKSDAKTVGTGYKLGAWRLGSGELVWVSPSQARPTHRASRSMPQLRRPRSQRPRLPAGRSEPTQNG